MKQATLEQLEQNDFLLYIYTPFCGTCNLARSMLEKIESVHQEDVFYEMNASFYPEFMQEEMVESVPCLLIKRDGKIQEKVYTFYSIPNIYTYLYEYKPEMFMEN